MKNKDFKTTKLGTYFFLRFIDAEYYCIQKSPKPLFSLFQTFSSDSVFNLYHFSKVSIHFFMSRVAWGNLGHFLEENLKKTYFCILF